MLGATEPTTACAHACPGGKYGNTTGHSKEAEACTELCSAGRYGNVVGQNSASGACPHVCPGGKYGTLAGQTMVSNACPNTCQPGRYGNVAAQTNHSIACPHQCAAGRYGALNGQTSLSSACPNLCPGGKYGFSEGQTMEPGACEYTCAGGKYGSVTGQTTEKGACPKRCPSGKYGNITGQTTQDAACKLCPGGRFGNTVGSTSLAQACGNVCPGGRYGNVSGQVSAERGCPYACGIGTYGNVSGSLNADGACPGRCPIGRYGHVLGATNVADACPEEFMVKVLNTDGEEYGDENHTRRRYNHFTEPILHVQWGRPNKTNYNHSFIAITEWPPKVHRKWCTQTWGVVYIPPCDQEGECLINQTLRMQMPYLQGTYNVSLYRWSTNAKHLVNETARFQTDMDEQGLFDHTLKTEAHRFNYSAICQNTTDFYGINQTVILNAYEIAETTSFVVQPALNIKIGKGLNTGRSGFEVIEGASIANSNYELPAFAIEMNSDPIAFTSDGFLMIQVDGKNCYTLDSYLQKRFARLALNGTLLNVREYNVTSSNWRNKFNGSWQTLDTIDNVHQDGGFECTLNVYLMPTNGLYRFGWDNVASIYSIGASSQRMLLNNWKGEVMRVKIPMFVGDDDMAWLTDEMRDNISYTLRGLLMFIFLSRFFSSLAWNMHDQWDLRDANNKAHISVAGARSPVCQVNDRRYHRTNIWLYIWVVQCFALTGQLRFVQDHGCTYGAMASTMFGFSILDGFANVGQFRPSWPTITQLPVAVGAFPPLYDPPPVVKPVPNATMPNITVPIPMCGNYTVETVNTWWKENNMSYWNYSLFVPTYTDVNQTSIANCTRKMCGNTTFDVAEALWEKTNRTALNWSTLFLVDAVEFGKNQTLLSCNATVFDYEIDCVEDGFCYDYDLARYYKPIQVEKADCSLSCLTARDNSWRTCNSFCSWLEVNEVARPERFNRTLLSTNSSWRECPCITPFPPPPKMQPVSIDLNSMIEPVRNDLPNMDGIERNYFPDNQVQGFMNSFLWVVIIVSSIFSVRLLLSVWFRYQMKRWIKEYRDCPVFTSRINVMVGGIVNLKVMTSSEVKEMKHRLESLKNVQSEADIAAGISGQASKGRLETNNANGLEVILERFDDYARLEKCALSVFMSFGIVLAHSSAAVATTGRDGYSGVGWLLATLLFLVCVILAYFYFTYTESRLLFKYTNLPDTLKEGKLLALDSDELRLLSIAHATRYGTWSVSGKDRHWKDRFGIMVTDYVYVRLQNKEFRPYMFGCYNMFRMFLYGFSIGALGTADSNGATQAWTVLMLQIMHCGVLAVLWPYNDRSSNVFDCLASGAIIAVIVVSFALPPTSVVAQQSIFGKHAPSDRHASELFMCVVIIVIAAGIVTLEFVGISNETAYFLSKLYIYAKSHIMRWKCVRRSAPVYASNGLTRPDEEKTKRKEEKREKEAAKLKKKKEKEIKRKAEQAKNKKNGTITVVVEEESSEDEDAEDPEDEIQRLKMELEATGFKYGGANFSEEDLVIHSTAASRKAVLQWVRKELRPLGKKTAFAGGVTKKQQKRDDRIIQEKIEAKKEESRRKVIEMKRFEEQKERFANKEVHILGPNVMTHRDVEDRRNVGYDALENS